MGIHTALLVWVNSTRSRHSRVPAASIVRLCLFACCVPAGHSLRRASRLPLLLRHGGNSCRGVRQMSEGFETGSALSQPSPGRFSTASLGWEPALRFLPLGERPRRYSYLVETRHFMLLPGRSSLISREKRKKRRLILHVGVCRFSPTSTLRCRGRGSGLCQHAFSHRKRQFIAILRG